MGRVARKAIRLLAISDTHCGHNFGLTPPDWWDYIPAGKPREIARRGWSWYIDFIKRNGPFALGIHCGDGIDGRARRAEGREVIGQPETQADMLLAVLEAARCPQWVMVEGTPYHASEGAQWEAQAAKRLTDRGAPVEFGERATIAINGYVIDVRHKIGGSQAPAGGDAALRSEIVRAAEWSAEYGYPTPHMILRGHVHRERIVAGGGRREARTLPALQLWTGFGARECGGLLHWGATWAEIDSDGGATWRSEVRPLRSESITPHVTL